MKSLFAHKVAALTAFQAFALIIAQPAYADTAQLLLRGTSDAVAGTLDVQLLTNEDTVATAFQAVTETKTQTIDFTDLAKGVVLMNYQRYDVAILKSTDFDPAHGGTLEITYLRNALNSSYRKIVVELVRNGDKWELMAEDQSGHHVVTKGFFKANRVFGQVVGIDSITLQ